MIQIKPKLHSVSCGGDHTVFVTKNNKVFACGKNENGQLGLGHTLNVSSPALVSFTRKVRKVVCGYEFTYFLTSSKVYSCGRNDSGQLGHNDTADHLVPALVTLPEGKKFPSKVVSVACGESHALLLCRDGSVYGTGYNGHGELGIGATRNVKVLTKINIPGNRKVIQIGCGESHTIFLTQKGMLFGCGSNKYCRLGLDKDTAAAFKPTHIKGIVNESDKNEERVIHFALGSGNSYFLTEKLNVFSIGYNSRHQLGFNDIEDRSELSKIKFPNDEKIVIIGAGSFSYNGFFITADNVLYVCGFNRYGQLGCGSKGEKMILRNVEFPTREKLVSVISSGHHTLFLTERYSIFSVGKNQHGQLMTGDTRERLVPTLLKELDPIFVSETNEDVITVKDLDSPKREIERKNIISAYLSDNLNVHQVYFSFFFEDDEDNKRVRLYCSHAVWCEHFRDLMNSGNYQVKLSSCYYPAVKMIKKWFKGKDPKFETVSVLKLTYDLSKKFKLFQLAYYIVMYLKKKFSDRVRDIIDLIFELAETNQTGSSLFLQCQFLIQQNYQEIVQVHAPYLLEKKTKKTSSLYFNIMAILYEKLGSIEEHSEFAGDQIQKEPEFSIKQIYQHHISELIDDDLTKNLVFKTTDNKIMKVHKEVVVKKCEYFRNMLTGGFLESKTRIVDIALNSETLVPIILFIYTGKIRFSLYDFTQLSIIQTCANKYCMKKLFRTCQDELKRRFVYNTFSDEDIMKMLNWNAELNIENMSLRFDLERTQENLKRMEFEKKKKKMFSSVVNSI